LTSKLDEERKAAMVSNLLVVLCSERSTQPIVNTGRCITEVISPGGGRWAVRRRRSTLGEP
jgi:hypothetical protein